MITDKETGVALLWFFPIVEGILRAAEKVTGAGL